MREIIICEDNEIQRNQICKYIEDYIAIKNYDLKIGLATEDPVEVLDYIKRHCIQEGVYFLDIKLGHHMTGFDLGTEIRGRDPSADIIMITGHKEMSYLIFEYKVEAMDYITKEDPRKMKKRIGECLDMIVYRRKKQSEKDESIFKIEEDGKMRFFKVEQIMFFQTSSKPHRLELHLKDGTVEFYGKLNEIEKQNPCFLKCHESVVVNTNNIKGIEKKTREVTMLNGESITASVRMIKVLFEKE